MLVLRGKSLSLFFLERQKKKIRWGIPVYCAPKNRWGFTTVRTLFLSCLLACNLALALFGLAFSLVGCFLCFSRLSP